MPTVRVYIDGFNLYHGIIQRNRLHWLDLGKFAIRLNSGRPVDKVIYCTAMVSGTPSDPNKAARQEAYLRAIELACPNVEIVKGQFTNHDQLRPIAGCKGSPTCAIRVNIRNEKGSDVNLASRLLHDAHLNRYDRAIVISGDSDLVEPIRLITKEIGKTIWVRNPRDVVSRELSLVASDYRRIHQSVLRKSQLPNPVTDGIKTYSMPIRWSVPQPTRFKTNILAAPCPLPGCSEIIRTCRYL